MIFKEFKKTWTHGDSQAHSGGSPWSSETWRHECSLWSRYRFHPGIVKTCPGVIETHPEVVMTHPSSEGSLWNHKASLCSRDSLRCTSFVSYFFRFEAKWDLFRFHFASLSKSNGPIFLPLVVSFRFQFFVALEAKRSRS
jgi:hypothetical protein